MKNKLPTILLSLSLIALVGLKVGDEVELDAYLNARTNPNFLKYSKNVTTQLAKGTTGEVEEVKKFNSGNSGIKMKITSGPKAGQSYWVYYNKDSSDIKLTNKDTQKQITADEIPVIEKSLPSENHSQIPKAPTIVSIPKAPIESETLADIAARRDMDEHAIQETAKAAAQTLKPSNISKAVTPTYNENCGKEKSATMTPPRVALAQGPSTVYTPMEALRDINSTKMKFVGRKKLNSSGSNQTCIFENENVYVYYDNCMASRKEAPATDFRVVSKNGGQINFYLEIYDTGRKMSDLKKSEYVNGTFGISYDETEKPPSNMNAAEAQQYMNNIEGSYPGFCFIGKTNQAASREQQGECSPKTESKLADWKSATEDFWKNPPAEWYSTQKVLRKLVETAPF
jgi:hypothetical protein